MSTAHRSELIILLHTLFSLSSEHVNLAMQATFSLGMVWFSVACMNLGWPPHWSTEFKVKTLFFIWVNMLRCLLHVIHASSEKITKFHSPQHWTSSAFCHCSVCCFFTCHLWHFCFYKSYGGFFSMMCTLQKNSAWMIFIWVHFTSAERPSAYHV